MPDKIVVRVKPGKNGKLLVCIGEHCVEVDAGALCEGEESAAVPERPRPDPPYMIRAREEALGDLGDADLEEALQRPDGITRGQEHIFVERLDG
jgi:hypothetical protein